jgi:hypothetical protein
MSVRILFAPVAGPMEVRDIEPTLATIQGLVGGSFEVVRLDHGIWLHVNGEGLLLGMPENRNVPGAVGPAFFARVDGEGELASLTDADVGVISAGLKTETDAGHGADITDEQLDAQTSEVIATLRKAVGLEQIGCSCNDCRLSFIVRTAAVAQLLGMMSQLAPVAGVSPQGFARLTGSCFQTGVRAVKVAVVAVKPVPGDGGGHGTVH